MNVPGQELQVLEAVLTTMITEKAITADMLQTCLRTWLTECDRGAEPLTQLELRVRIHRTNRLFLAKYVVATNCDGIAGSLRAQFSI